MRAQQTHSEETLIELSDDERRCIWNCLSEITNGFILDNYEAMTGFTQEKTADFRLKLTKIKKNPAPQLFSKGEIYVMIVSIQESLKELEWEFSIRVGVKEEEAQALLAELKDVYAKMQA